MVEIYNLCKSQVVFVNVELLDGKSTIVVLLKKKKQTYLFVEMFSNIFIAVSKEVVFWQCGAITIFC